MQLCVLQGSMIQTHFIMIPKVRKYTYFYTDAILKGYFGIFYANFNMQNSEKHAKFSAPHKLSLNLLLE